METVFNATLAASLQYVTFPLELTGLTLALIEVRFPSTAAYITRQIERLSVPMQEIRSGRSGRESTMERSLSALLTRLLKVGFYVLSAVYGARLVYQFVSRGPAPDWLIGWAIGYLVSAIVMTTGLVILGLATFFLVVGGSDFAHRFVAGRAIGTLGILIAGLGLLGEFYQVITQLVH